MLRASTTFLLSLRLPPTANKDECEAKLIEKLTTSVPYNAKVTAKGGQRGQGWCMKDMPAFLKATLKKASYDFFDNNKVGI